MANFELKFEWSARWHVRDQSIGPQALGENLERLRKRCPKRKRLAEYVVDQSRPARSALHSQFEWDDAKAAEAHRRDQATQLLCAVRVRYADDKEPVPYLVSIQSDDSPGGRRYVNTLLDIQGKQTREDILAQAVADLRRWQRRYDGLTELASVYRAIRKVG